LHKYLRAVGFSEYTEKKQIQSLVKEIIVHADERSCTTLTEKSLIAEFDRNFAEDIGIAVCGEFDDEDNYTFDYYFPYLRSETVSSGEDISIERHAAKESYAGICDDPRVGVSLIFYLHSLSEAAGRGQIADKRNVSESFGIVLPRYYYDADTEERKTEKEDCKGYC